MLRRMLGPAERRATMSEPPDWLWDAFGAVPTYSGRAVTPQNSLELIGVFAAVKLLATQVASLPMVVYQGEGNDRTRARDAWQWELLHEKPNDEQASDVFYETVMAHLNLWGNFYGEKQLGRDPTGRRRVMAVWPVHPGNVTVSRDPDSGRKRFKVAGSDSFLYSDTILHIPAFGYDGLRGLSPIATERQALGAMQARDETVGRFYANGATPGGVLQTTGTLSEEAAQRLKAQWEAAHRGSSNAGRVAVLEDGVTWQGIGMPLVDQQYIEQKHYDINEIARIFQIPPEMLGGERNRSLTYANVEGQSIHFKVYSLNHWLVRIEKALRADPDLFNVPDLYPEFLSEGLLRGDSASRVAYYEGLTRVKAITPNEIREKENMPPLDGGDEIAPAPGAAAPTPGQQPASSPTDQPAGDGGTQPGDGGAVRGNGHLSREEFLDAIERVVERPPPVVNVQPAELRIEDGAIRVEAPPAAEVRFEEGAIQTHVAAPETHIHQPGRRTVEFSDGRTATIEED